MSQSIRPVDGIDGKYRLVERLGADGAIERYLAEHTAIRRPVELHRLAVGRGSDTEAAAQIRRAARVLGGATHRNLQGIVDSGEEAGGRPYLVLEALRGRSLADLLAQSPEGIPTQRAARIVVQVLEAVRALHEGGVMLRCLAPEDVMVEAVSAGDELVKVRGVGAAVFADEAGAPLRTSGYSAYIAPEIRRGEGADVRSDFYSVGMILRALLIGGDAGSDTARRAIARACAEDPDERFSSADSFLQAVALLLPTSDRPPREQMVTPTDPLHADLQYLHLRRTTRQREPDREDSRLTLLTVLLTIEAIYRRFGAGVWAELTARVPDAESLLPGSGHTPVHIEQGVPVSLFAEILVTVDEIAGRGDLALIADLGEAVAKRGLRRLFPDLPHPITPDSLIAGFPYLWGRISRDGKARVVRVSEKSARLSVERQVTPSLEIAGLVAGIVRQSLREAGAESAEVVLISSEALGDAKDLFGVEWSG